MVAAGNAKEILVLAGFIMRFLLVASIACFIVAIFSKGGRRFLFETIAALTIVAVVFIAIFSTMKAATEDKPTPAIKPETFAPAVDDGFLEAVAPEKAMDPIPPWGWSIAGIALIAGAVALIVIGRRPPQDRTPLPEEDENLAKNIGLVAKSAASSFEAGESPSRTVIVAYLEMLRLVTANKELSRRQSDTAREFESVLIAAGLPKADLDALTALFERARYAEGELGDEDARIARKLLEHIASALLPAPVALPAVSPP